jgi:hypothetical protein
MTMLALADKTRPFGMHPLPSGGHTENPIRGAI